MDAGKNLEEAIQEMFKGLTDKLDSIESRLVRLEKVDSIEHRVTVNQIDLNDIKELLQRVEDEKVKINLEQVILEIDKNLEKLSKYIGKRLDSQLLRIAKLEEELQELREEV